jgi:hypothetical protein
MDQDLMRTTFSVILPRWISWLEKKLGWLSIPHLGMILVCLQVLGYAFARLRPDLTDALVLDASAVLAGEVWRVVTFIAIPLSDSFLMLFVLWFLYYIFRTLRREWGDFKFSLYFLLAWLGTVCGALAFDACVESFVLIEITFFFAIATLFPNYEVQLFYILPIKMKWITIPVAILMVVQQVFFSTWQMSLCLALACINYICFFGPSFYRTIQRELQRHKGK